MVRWRASVRTWKLFFVERVEGKRGSIADGEAGLNHGCMSLKRCVVRLQA